MRRLSAFALVVACMFALSACGESAVLDASDTSQAPPPSEEPVTVFSCGGMEVALPSAFLDQLLVETEFPDAAESWKPLISVYEKTSFEEAQADFGGGCGFLFGLLAMDQAAFEQSVCSDSPGQEIFATDGERYYACTFPTDVQFYRSGRSGSGLLDHPDWPAWEALNEIGPAVQEDFLTRNGLSAYNETQLLEQPFTYVGNHVYLKYFPYLDVDGDKRPYRTLVLSQPVIQGEGGVWAVERWLDEYGCVYLYFPDTGKPAAEYYANLQAECDAGQHPELLTPAGAARTFIKNSFDREASPESFAECDGDTAAYTEANLRLRETVLDVMAGREVDGLELLNCMGRITEDNWGTLGRRMYGSEWWPPLRAALEAAAVGGNQQDRDRNLMAFSLAIQNSRADFQEAIGQLFQAQVSADPEAFAAALSEFSQEEQEYIQLYTGALQ